MKKRKVAVLILLSVMACAMVLTGCKKKNKKDKEETQKAEPVIQVVTEEKQEETPVVEEAPAEESREGMYRSELTNEWTDEALKNQRPIAVMVDNEKTALPHYGLSQADIVYEITNSLANEGVTRLMALFKDYNSVKQIGSIRSTRPTNLQLIPEWNAIICHDGGPFYIDDYIAKDYVDNISGEFSRVDNGKSREFTEYILAGDVDKGIANHKYSATYNDYYPGSHFIFASEVEPNDLSADSNSKDASVINMPYKHNKPVLEYDSASRTYLYSEYGQKHTDPGNDNTQLAFTNLIIQNCRYVKFDDNGYMMFHSIDFNRDGYYISGGKAIPITWSKEDELSPTKYYDLSGNEIILNTGKTYIALVPDDLWKNLEIK